MSEYTIVTDSGSDISLELLAEWGVKCAELTFHYDGDTKAYRMADIPIKEFYRQMREGKVFKTAAANIGDFTVIFEEELAAGRDVLYVGFSSGLSNTCNAAQMAADELKEKYPERRIYTYDTLCASAGEGLLLHYVVELKKSGASIEESAKFIEDNMMNLCHWFTVDDLVYLKRGGRISSTAAFAATVLGIKPVMHVDNEGHLINMSKVQGRKKSIKALANKYMELAKDPEGGIYYISHGDCIEDVRYLEDQIESMAGHRAALVTNVGPVIGSHSGPGTLALFFLGKTR